VRRSWVILWVALASPALGAEPPVVQSATPAPDLDALFVRADGWIGADGAFSVSLSPRRTLWLFSDTWVGKVRDGRRTDATVVNNTVGVQEGSGGRLTYTIAGGPGRQAVGPDRPSRRARLVLAPGRRGRPREAVALPQPGGEDR
jgi:hypothetical protein